MQLVLGDRQRLLGGGNLFVETCSLLAEGIWRNCLALLKVQPQQRDLLSFQLLDQLGFGGADLVNALLADSDQRFNRRGALGYVICREAQGAVLTLDCLLDQFRPDIGSH
ncbi:MAG TPA: hypothetical protein VFK14_12395 [Solirubrobacterales bacterium]|nr:hypothetical protein [Solirubrobacterales bacterium]